VPSADCLALWPPPPGLPKLFQARLGEPHGPQERTRTRGATDALMLNLPNNRFVCNFEIRKTPGGAPPVGRDPDEIQIPARHHDVADLQGRWFHQVPLPPLLLLPVPPKPNPSCIAIVWVCAAVAKSSLLARLFICIRNVCCFLCSFLQLCFCSRLLAARDVCDVSRPAGQATQHWEKRVRT